MSRHIVLRLLRVIYLSHFIRKFYRYPLVVLRMFTEGGIFQGVTSYPDWT
jgi:hypothetical protein